MITDHRSPGSAKKILSADLDLPLLRLRPHRRSAARTSFRQLPSPSPRLPLLRPQRRSAARTSFRQLTSPSPRLPLLRPHRRSVAFGELLPATAQIQILDVGLLAPLREKSVQSTVTTAVPPILPKPAVPKQLAAGAILLRPEGIHLKISLYFFGLGGEWGCWIWERPQGRKKKSWWQQQLVAAGLCRLVAAGLCRHARADAGRARAGGHVLPVSM